MIKLELLPWSQPVAGAAAFQVLRGHADPNDPYSEYNLCDYVGDNPVRVYDARLELCQRLGISYVELVMPRQTHGTRVAVVDLRFMRTGINSQKLQLDGVDALVTKLRGVCIGVNTADCVPIALFDPEAGVVAVAHAGWRGTVARIAREVVLAMEHQGALPQRIVATMGASIGPECFEVGPEVVQQFAQAGFDVDAIVKRHTDAGKAYIDLRLANRHALEQAGVLPSHIADDTPCSRCHCERYFSARRLGIASGRTFTGVILTKPDGSISRDARRFF